MCSGRSFGTSAGCRPIGDRNGAPAAGEDGPLVRLRGISRSFGRLLAVKPLDLDIRHGDFLAVLGPSGCGKTTLLRMIGGFVTPSSGSIEIDGRDVTFLSPDKRPTNMVFQGYGLFPHMKVRQNIAYGLRIAGRPRSEIAARVDEALALIRLEDFADRDIDMLSGGQQQRVALARALVMRPKVLLLDEPLAALDLKLRQSMQEELRRIHQQIGGTFVFVTHDQGEALALANRVAVMEEGRVVQEGDAEDIYFKPRTRFVSTFIGEANMFEATRTGGRVGLRDGKVDLSFEDHGPDGPVAIVVRPEFMRLHDGADTADFALRARLDDILFLGPTVRFLLTTDGGRHAIAHTTDLELRHRVRIGDAVRIGWSAEHHRAIGP